LSYELKKNGLSVEKEKPLPIIYDDVKLDCGYRLDIFVANKVIIEVKSV
jgi:GxxExxY protein